MVPNPKNRYPTRVDNALINLMARSPPRGTLQPRTNRLNCAPGRRCIFTIGTNRRCFSGLGVIRSLVWLDLFAPGRCDASFHPTGLGLLACGAVGAKICSAIISLPNEWPRLGPARLIGPNPRLRRWKKAAVGNIPFLEVSPRQNRPWAGKKQAKLAAPSQIFKDLQLANDENGRVLGDGQVAGREPSCRCQAWLMKKLAAPDRFQLEAVLEA